jgi:SAM-dependent MidA family methyltransferase
MKMPTERIREEIGQTGTISFARFMELALYCPETGYYEKKKDIVGRQGDFITSVSVGSLFGELLAFQFAQWLDELSRGRKKLNIIEAGAHDGKLAADILNWLQLHKPDLFSKIEYIILEPSPSRQQWQHEKLKPFSNVSWRSSLTDGQSPLEGILFSNELLDAFPVNRLGWDRINKRWYEWGVTLDGDKFCWSRISLDASHLPDALLHLPSELLEVLPNNYTVETSPAAEAWWREAAGSLKHGKLLAIDYGFANDEMLSPARTKGTLRAYHRHHVTDDLLANPGEQDLTAHVDFSAIQKAGESAGLNTEAFCTQPQFLTRILARAVTEKHWASMDAKQVRQFQTLTHPDHLGRAFRVLVQAR